MTKEAHFTNLSEAEEFVDAAIDNALDVAGRESVNLLHHLNHAVHSNTFILIFNDPNYSSWTVTYEIDDVQAAAC